MRFAILGLGSIGLRHAKNLLAMGYDVTGYDPDLKRCNLLREYNGKISVDRHSLLRESDAVVIATPNSFHLHDLHDAIKNHCNIFIEKPLATTLKNVELILQEAQQKSLVVFVGMNLRYHPGVILARKLIKSDQVGKILWARLLLASYLPAWRQHQDHTQGYAADPKTGGVLFDGIHEIDLANYLLGPAELISASAHCTGTINIESEDCADLILQHPNGVRSSIHLDYVTRPEQRITEIVGTKAMMKIDLRHRQLYLTNHRGETILHEIFSSSFDDDYQNEMQSFVNCVETGELPHCDGMNAFAVLKQVIQARAKTGLRVCEN